MQSHLLSWLTFTPLIGMLVVLAAPKGSSVLIRIASLVATFLPLVLATLLYFFVLRRGSSAYELVERVAWIRSIRAEYYVGVDGPALLLVWLTSLLMFIAVSASAYVEGAGKAWYALLLLLEACVLAALVSLDFFLFFAFCELTLLVICLSIGIWGGARRAQLASGFMLVALAGSMLILVAIVALRLDGGTFSIPALVELARAGKLSGVNLSAGGSLFGMPFTTWCCWCLILGFAIKFAVAALLLFAPRRFALPVITLLAALGVAIAQLVELWRSIR